MLEMAENNKFATVQNKSSCVAFPCLASKWWGREVNGHTLMIL